MSAGRPAARWGPARDRSRGGRRMQRAKTRGRRHGPGLVTSARRRYARCLFPLPRCPHRAISSLATCPHTPRSLHISAALLPSTRAAALLPCTPPPPTSEPMAAITTGSAVSFARPVKAINVSFVSFAGLRKDNVAFRLQPVTQRFAVLCAAKKETVEKVCDIVKKQLVLPEGTEVTGSSKFTDLGADSLDTVEIVMGLEEAFKISVEESSAQSIATVEDAAELIDKLVDAQ